jgi:putative ABC transport system permease protein
VAALPNVAALEARSSVDVRLLVGARRAAARVIGVRDFARQGVDVVRVESGSFPRGAEVLADVQDANVGVYDGDAGDRVAVIGASGARTGLVVSGRGRSLPGGEQVQDEDVVVLYASPATVAALSGETGSDELALRLDDASPAAAARTVEAVRRRLRTYPHFAGFSDLPDVRAPGDWPGKVETEKFAQLLSVITLLALLSALVLVSNTMTTLVAEQTSEIGVMRAIGARRRQVALIYLRTAFLLGALGALVGIGLGIVLSSLLARYFGSMFWAVDVGFGVDPTVLAVSLAVALAAPPLAALPAVRRGLHVDLREALESEGSAVATQDGADRLLRRAGFLPRVMQIGVRNLGRRKRRSLATAVIVALAVANLLAVLGLVAGVTEATHRGWADHLEDVQISTGGRALFDERAERAIRSAPGVAEVEPVLKNTVELAGREAFVWGVERDPLLRYRLSEGRWLDSGDERAAAQVAVIERNLAQLVGVGVGDRMTLRTAGGDARFLVVGVATNQQEEGTAVYVPLTTVRRLLARPAGASAYWVRTDSRDHALVDRTTSRVEDRLAALGYQTTSEIRYVAERDEVAANRTITTTIALLGFLIVAMSVVGLANAITTSVLERTREIGILRCIGARGRDVRHIFTTEGVALALAGWALGIPLGYVLDRVFVWLVWKVVEVRVPAAFPLWNVVIALVGTVVLALLVLLLPVRRASRLRPGDALRYA